VPRASLPGRGGGVGVEVPATCRTTTDGKRSVSSGAWGKAASAHKEGVRVLSVLQYWVTRRVGAKRRVRGKVELHGGTVMGG